jgi:hypothetical protein
MSEGRKAMHVDYTDIRSKITELPVWFDEHAVPRYCPFEPERCANIYCDEAVLAEITCQGCHRAFSVALSQDSTETYERGGCRLADDIRDRALHFGDPPNVGCCLSGPTMNSEPRRVLQYWSCNHREHVQDGRVVNVEKYMEWRRDPTLEIEIAPDWVLDSD